MDTQSQPTIKDFVLQQAQQKAFEIMAMGLKDYERSKQQIIKQKKEQIHNEFDRLNKQNQASKRIHHSSLINQSRMTKMHIRQKNLQSLLLQSQYKLARDIIDNKSFYIKILKNFIIECLIKMLQPVVLIRCLQRDAKLIQGILNQCKRQYQQLILKEGIPQDYAKIELKLDQRFLDQRVVSDGSNRVSKNEENNKCFGGIILTNQNGLIICKNTLDTRLQLAFQQMLPHIRRELFN